MGKRNSFIKMNSWRYTQNSKGNLKRYNMRKSYSSKLRSSQCMISGIELQNASPHVHKNRIGTPRNVKKLCAPSYEKHHHISYKSMSPRREYNKQKLLIKGKSSKTGKNNLKFPKQDDDDNDNDDLLVSSSALHRKTYNIRKRFSRETSSNTDINIFNSPGQSINGHGKSNTSALASNEPYKKRYNTHKSLAKEMSSNTIEIIKNDHDKSETSASISHEPDRKIYNTRKRLSKETFRNTNVNNSKSPDLNTNNDSDNDDSDSGSVSNYKPPRKVYNTRKQYSNNLSTSDSYDVISIDGMKYVKAVRWDHPNFQSNINQYAEKKCGMVVKNITIENICKFNNIHYSKPVFNKTQFSRIYVDELNMLLSIYPIQSDDNLISVNTRIRKRKCKVLRKGSLRGIYQQSGKSSRNKITKSSEMEQLSPQTLKHSNQIKEENMCNAGIIDDSRDFNKQFPKIFLQRLYVPSTTQPSNLLLFNTMCRLNETSYRKKFASQDEHGNHESKDSLQKVNEIPNSVLNVSIENIEQQTTLNGFVNNKIDIVCEKRYPLRNRHVIE